MMYLTNRHREIVVNDNKYADDSGIAAWVETTPASSGLIVSLYNTSVLLYNEATHSPSGNHDPPSKPPSNNPLIPSLIKQEITERLHQKLQTIHECQRRHQQTRSFNPFPTPPLIPSLIKQEITERLHQKPQTIHECQRRHQQTHSFNPFSNETPDRAPDKTGNNREAASETTNDPRVPTPPPTDPLFQPFFQRNP
jgi:hypothetical protein